MKRKLTVLITILAMLVCAVFAVVGCGPEEVVPAGPAGGTYYCVTNDDYKITLGDNNKFTFKVAGEDRQGTYRFAGNTLILTFDDNTTIEATLDNYNELNFEYKNQAYEFLRETNFKVKFETSGGSAVTEQTVKNGKKATKPSSPTKNGEIFTGWYADKDLENKFDFESAITKDTTLYAKYIEAIAKDPEFTAKFANVDTAIEPVQTKGGIVDINKVAEPSRSNDKFLGWYVSASNDGNKLTYKYDFQVLYENTTLYALWESELEGAPEVSVYNGKVTWKGEGATMKIKTPGGGTETPQVNGNEYTIPTSTLTNAGEYEITVTIGEKSTTMYYVHKGLARVSVFKIEENTVQFNMVENAATYVLTITTKTGDQTLEVTTDEGNRVGHADFSACDIPENGYVFKVRAEATGYVASESEPYTYNRVLGSVANITVDEATQDVTWDSVAKATGYIVDIDGTSYSVQEAKATLRSLDPKALTIKVQPTAFGYNSPAATEKAYNKVKLAVPENIRLEGNDLVWDDINGVREYEITINGQKYTSSTAQFTLSESYMQDGKMEITIVAKGDTEDKNSPVSELKTIRNGEIGNVRYEAGKLKWDASFGTANYEVQVGNGDIVPVSGATEKDIILTGKKTELKVRIQDTEDWHTVTVNAYKIRVRMGLNGDPSKDMYYGTMYKADGDPIDFDNTDSIIWDRGDVDKPTYKQRTGYDFAGFFSDDFNNGGEAYENKTYTLKKDTEFVAHWTPHTHDVSFNLNFTFFENYDKGGFTGTEETINLTQFTYDSKEYDWPVPEQIVAGYMFEGWYLFDIDGNPSDIAYYNTQHKFADQYGASSGDKALTFDKNIIAYAKWVRVVNFVENNSGWTATKNDEYKSMARLTIPAKYKDKTVTQIENFQSCLSLTEINIPETVTSIHMGEGGEAFKYCSKLVNVNIYKVDDFYDTPKYCSDDGVIYENDSEGNPYKLFYYPYGRLYSQGNIEKYQSYTVKAGTQVIAMGAFYGPSGSTSARDFATVNIPASVQEIESNAFYMCYGLHEINFLPAQEGESESSNIVLSEDSFKTCPNVTMLNLPKRLQSISSKLLQVFTKLDKITVEQGGKYYAKDNVLYMTRDDKTRELVFYPIAKGFVNSEYSIPTDVQHIGEGAFRKARTLKTLTITAQVESIGKEAFMDSTYIQTIKFLGTATNKDLTIGEQAFYNVSNGSKTSSTTAPYIMVDYALTLPENLVGLGAFAFGSNERITEVEFKTKSRQTVEFAQYAFAKKPTSTTVNPTYDAYVTKVTINAEVPTFNIMNVMGKKLTTVMILGDNPNFEQDDIGAVFNPDFSEMLFFPADFNGTYEIPEGMTVIPDEMFMTRSLKGIHIHNKVRMIGRRAFYNCKELVTLTFEDGTLLEDDPGLVIGESAFDGCAKLNSVELPHTLTQLNNYAFARCTVLESINIPNSVRLMQVVSGKFQVFYQSKKLKSVEIQDGNPNYIAVDGVLYTVREVKKGDSDTELVADTLLWCPQGASGEVVVPSSVRTVAGYAFYNVDGLQKVTFSTLEATENADEEHPDVVDLTIGGQAFYEEYSATSADKPQHGIEEIRFPGGMKILGNQSGSTLNVPIYYLTSLKKVFIPNTIEKLYSFQYYCSNISEIEFEQGGEVGLQIIGSSASSTYYGPLGDLPLITSVTLPERVTLLENFPFAYYSSGEDSTTFRCYINEVKFTESDTFDLTLGAAAFYRMENLKVTLPKNLVTIDPGTSKYYYGVFYHSSFANDTLDLSNTKLEVIGRSAFQYTSGLKHVIFPSSLETLGQDAFQGYTTGSGSDLETITFTGPSNLKEFTSAFEYQTKLNKVTFADEAAEGDDGKPKTLDLTDSVFRCCYALRDIKLPYYIKTIGEDVFEKCTALSSVEFAVDDENMSYLEEIGTNAFSYISATEFTLPLSHAANGIKLNPQVFLNSLNLRTLNISDSVRDLTGALEGTLIDTINTDKDGTPGSPYFSIDNETHTLKDNNGNIILIFADTETYVIPAGTQKIGNGAFMGIVGLKKIVIPESVMEIGANAFKDCLDLQTVEFAADSKLTKIGDRAFSGCTSLISADFTPCTRLNSVGNYLFERCASIQSVKFSQSIKLFTSTTKSTYMFWYSGLRTFDFNDFGGGATAVPNYFFQYCRSLTSVTFSSSIKTLPSSSSYSPFLGCTALTTLENYGAIETWCTLSDTAIESFTMRGKSTGGKAITYPSSFFGTSSASFVNNHLTSVKFDDTASSISTIKSNMFTSCVKLSDFDFTKLTGLKTIEATAFKNTGLIDVDLTKCTQLSTVKATIFQNCAKLQSVKMDACTSVTKLDGASVFEGCTSLTDVFLPSSLTYLGTKTFSGCSNLRSIDLSALAQLQYIGNAAGKAALSTAAENFKNCTSLTTVKLPDAGGIYLGKAVFSGCTALESFDFTKVVQIGDNCFEKSGLTSVDIPSTVTETWGVSPFSGCEKLTSVHFADGYDVLGNKRLDSCTALVNVDISNTGYTVLPNYFFYKCSALESVTLPAAITDLGNYAFTDCTALDSFDFTPYSSITTVSAYCFNGCKDLQNVTLTENIKAVARYAFKGCTSLETIDMSMTKVTLLGGDGTGGGTYDKLTMTAETFSGCSALTTVKFPATCVGIAGKVFMDCTSLKTIDLSKITDMGANVFDGVVLDSLTIPVLTTFQATTFSGLAVDGKIDIGSNAKFKLVTVSDEETGVSYVELRSIDDATLYLTGKPSVDIKPVDGVVDLSTMNLAEAATKAILSALPEGVNKVILPKSLVEIGEKAFYELTMSVDEIVVPDGVTSIGKQAFGYLKGVRTITLPSTLTELGEQAFNYAEIEEITIPKSVKTIGKQLFNRSKVHVVKFEDDPAATEQISLADGLFYYSQELTTVKLPKNLTVLPAETFYHTDALSDVNLNELAITTIGKSAFGYSGLTEFTAPASLTLICSSAFNQAKITTVTFNDNAHITLESTAFGSSKLNTINWPKGTGTVTLRDRVFNATDLVNVEIPSCVKFENINASVEEYNVAVSTFLNCKSLQSCVFVGESELTEACGMFNGCSELRNVVLPEGITRLGFSHVYAVTSSGDSTQTGMFKDCSNLQTVKLPETLEEIAISNVFTNCTSISRLVIPEKVNIIETSLSTSSVASFGGWTDEQTIVIKGDRYTKIKVLGLGWYVKCNAKVVWGGTDEPAAQPQSPSAESSTAATTISGETVLLSADRRRVA